MKRRRGVGKGAVQGDDSVRKTTRRGWQTGAVSGRWAWTLGVCVVEVPRLPPRVVEGPSCEGLWGLCG